MAAMPSKEWKGANSMDREALAKVLPMEILRWDEAFERQWDSDAHFVCYTLRDDEEQLPRCNKRMLPHLREIGGDLLTRVFALDFDNPGHAAWTEEALEQWLEQLIAVAFEDPVLWSWALLYTTKHGARLVYILDRPIPVDEAEGFHRWLVMQWHDKGIQFDTSCSDWTRLFRLPNVVRDTKTTWTQSYYQFVPRYEQRLDVSKLGRIDNPLVKRKGVVREFNLPQPAEDIDTELLTTISDKGREVMSDWLRKAKARLKNRACYPCIFEHKQLAHEGGRHNTILKYVGESTTLLFGLEDESHERMTTPQHIYALLLAPVQQLEPDSDTHDWTEVLWTHVLYCWANEDAEDRLRQEEDEQLEQDAMDQLDRVVEGMREWCDSPKLLGSDYDAKAWALRHLIAVGSGGSYIMRPDGWFDSVSTSNHSMVPRVRALGMDRVIQIKIPSGEGFRWASAQELMNEYGTVVSEISGMPQIKGAYISDIDQSNSNLRLRLYGRRTDIPAQYNARVDEWLKRLFGERYDEAINWIGHSLAFEEGPIAAISIQGAAGAGKKMFAYGLAECVDTQTLAQGEDLIGHFQPGLMRSPYLLVDEGWPARRGGKHPADMFRELVGGSTRTVDRKFRDPVQCTNPVRIIFTANDLNVVRMLSAGKDLSPEDREALGIRLLHFDISHQATFWLRKRGGARLTRGWIAPDGGGPSDFVVAKHFLWCYEEKRQPRAPRFLVEGNSASGVMFDLRTQSGNAPVVIESIIRMLEVEGKKWEGLVVEDYKLYVLSSEILQFWRSEMKNTTGTRLSAQIVGQVMRGLTSTVSRNSIQLKSRPLMNRKRWHEVDCKVLQVCAEKVGWPSTVLDKLVADQEKMGIIYKRDEEAPLGNFDPPI